MGQSKVHLYSGGRLARSGASEPKWEGMAMALFRERGSGNARSGLHAGVLVE